MKDRDGGTQATLPCKVSLGMFSTERAIVVELPDGRRISALVDMRNVRVPKEPAPGGEVDGRVTVFIVSSTRDSVILELPQAGFTEGPRLEVPKALLSS